MDQSARLRRTMIVLVLAVPLVPLTTAAQPRLSGRPVTGPPRISVTLSEAPTQPRFGTADASYVRDGFSEFFPTSSGAGYTDCYVPCPIPGRSSDGVLTGPQPKLPGGAQLTYVELDFCDDSVNAAIRLDVVECDYRGMDCSFLTTLQTTPAGTFGCSSMSADLTSLNYTVDNFFREIFTYVDAPAETLLTGVIWGYRLQVSPAPATATFPDVPVGSQFHRYVEALVDAGITAGCGGGNYCPNSPITRGQMAAFLSIALGLHWPQ